MTNELRIEVSEVEIYGRKRYERGRDNYRFRKPRLYIWADNDDTGYMNDVVNRLLGIRRGKTMIDLYRKFLLTDPKVAEVIRTGENKKEGWTPKFRWSNTAGCECPCSPGFIVSNDEYGFNDYYILYKAPKGLQIELDRKDALAA
jgi:hypothetical protein